MSVGATSVGPSSSWPFVVSCLPLGYCRYTPGPGPRHMCAIGPRTTARLSARAPLLRRRTLSRFALPVDGWREPTRGAWPDNGCVTAVARHAPGTPWSLISSSARSRARSGRFRAEPLIMARRATGGLAVRAGVEAAAPPEAFTQGLLRGAGAPQFRLRTASRFALTVDGLSERTRVRARTQGALRGQRRTAGRSGWSERTSRSAVDSGARSSA
jgi:hypothetical protein